MKTQALSRKVIVKYAPISERYWHVNAEATIYNGQIKLGGCWFNFDDRYIVEDDTLTQNIKNARYEIGKVVEQVLKDYTGGEKFFDALDASINGMLETSAIMPALYDMTDSKVILLSGGFGKKFAELIDEGKVKFQHYVLFKGGLRNGAAPEFIRSNYTIAGEDLVFVDDTIYGGLTMRVLRDYMKEHYNAQVQKTVVVYDGCPEVREGIDSIYRYYDEFDSVPSFDFKNI